MKRSSAFLSHTAHRKCEQFSIPQLSIPLLLCFPGHDTFTIQILSAPIYCCQLKSLCCTAEHLQHLYTPSHFAFQIGVAESQQYRTYCRAGRLCPSRFPGELSLWLLLMGSMQSYPILHRSGMHPLWRKFCCFHHLQIFAVYLLFSYTHIAT